ncbi:MAG: DUF3330 domain-containing protein [Thiobacillaceae bacterium]
MVKPVNTTPSGATLMDCESDHQCTVLTCDMCLVELPNDAAMREEGEDYIAHFCGLDCLDQWRRQRAQAARQPQQQ